MIILDTNVLSALMRTEPEAVPLDRADTLHRLIVDPAVDPNYFSSAAWMLLDKSGRIPDEPRAIADWLETDSLAQDLLTQGPVGRLAGELPMTAARRWLLLSDAWPAYPRVGPSPTSAAACPKCGSDSPSIPGRRCCGPW